MNYLITTTITTILTAAFCVYIYKAKNLITFLLTLLPVGGLFIAANFLSMISLPMYWLLIITLACGFVLFSNSYSDTHITPFVFAPLLSAFVYVYISVIIEGHLDPFWFIGILPLLAITTLISMFWGAFILFLRHE